MGRLDDIRTGSIVTYPYLWDRQAARGETEGRKDRPTAVAIRLPGPNGDTLFLLAITSRQPDPATRAVEIPEAERRRGGLSTYRRLWLVIDEMNVDVIGRSYYLRPRPPLGSFSDRFFAPILRSIINDRTIRQIDRTR